MIDFSLFFKLNENWMMFERRLNGHGWKSIDTNIWKFALQKRGRVHASIMFPSLPFGAGADKYL